MAKPTGPGKTEVRTNPPSLLLYNFDIDGDALKEEHRTFLRKEALPALRAGRGVSVIGLTDRSGSASHNLSLSDRRVARTIEFLRQETPTGVNLIQATGFGEAAAAREGDADGSYDDRFRSVLVFLQPAAPPVTRTQTIEVAAKSFIALIGSNVGTMPGITLKPNPIPPFVPPVVPVPRQVLLVALAKATDAQFNEDPRTVAKDKHYRLFTSCRFTVVFEDNKILAATPSIPDLDTDVGKEGPIQPPPLIASAVSVSPKGGSSVTFSWTAKGRPDPLVEPAFQEVRERTSVFIWHIVEGKIDVSSGTPVTTVTIRGSRFPSHRAFINGLPVIPDLKQGQFSNLWDADFADFTKVR
jgi:hypothetical protein